jgi:hypothetical protein
MTRFMLKALGLWGLFGVLAILNGMVREKWISPLLGPSAALPLSGGILSISIFLTTLAFIPKFGLKSPRPCWALGALWVLWTVAFEFLLGRYAMGKSWSEFLQVFDMARGNFMLLVLLTTAISPLGAWRLRAEA